MEEMTVEVRLTRDEWLALLDVALDGEGPTPIESLKLVEALRLHRTTLNKAVRINIEEG